MKLTEKYDDNILEAKKNIIKQHNKLLKEEEENEKNVIKKILDEFNKGFKKGEKRSILFKNYSFLSEENKIEINNLKKISKNLFEDMKEYELSEKIEEIPNGYETIYVFDIYLKRIK